MKPKRMSTEATFITVAVALIVVLLGLSAWVASVSSTDQEAEVCRLTVEYADKLIETHGEHLHQLRERADTFDTEVRLISDSAEYRDMKERCLNP